MKHVLTLEDREMYLKQTLKNLDLNRQQYELDRNREAASQLKLQLQRTQQVITYWESIGKPEGMLALIEIVVDLVGSTF